MSNLRSTVITRCLISSNFGNSILIEYMLNSSIRRFCLQLSVLHKSKHYKFPRDLSSQEYINNNIKVHTNNICTLSAYAL